MHVTFWVDGGMLGGSNPSTIGVFYSVACELPGEPEEIVIAREEDRSYFTNNEAEWLAVRAALRYAQEHHPEAALLIHSDSQLVVNQFSTVFKINKRHLYELACECWALARFFPRCKLEWRSRREMVKKLGH